MFYHNHYVCQEQRGVLILQHVNKTVNNEKAVVSFAIQSSK